MFLFLLFIFSVLLLGLSLSALNSPTTAGETMALIVVDILFAISTAVLFVTIDFANFFNVYDQHPLMVLVNVGRTMMFAFGLIAVSTVPRHFRWWKERRLKERYERATA